MQNKLIVASGLAAIIISVSAMSVSAWNHGPKVIAGYNMMGTYGATIEENQKFLDETRDDRIKLAATQTELNALMTVRNPDKIRVRTLSTNIGKLLTTIQERAHSYGYEKGQMSGNEDRIPGKMKNEHCMCPDSN